MLHMMFKLSECAEKNWRKLRGFAYLAKVIEGVKFVDGEEVQQPDQVAALFHRHTPDLTIALSIVPMLIIKRAYASNQHTGFTGLFDRRLRQHPKPPKPGQPAFISKQGFDVDFGEHGRWMVSPCSGCQAQK